MTTTALGRDRRIATGVAAGVCAFAAAIVALSAYAMPLIPAGGGTRWGAVPVALECLVAPLVGLAIVNRHPRHVIGWLLVLHGLLVPFVFCGDIYASYSHYRTHNSWPAGQWMAVATEETWPLLFVPLGLVGYVFPDGRFLSRRWRRFVVICLVLQMLFMVAATLTLTQFSDASVKSIPVPYEALPSAPFAPIQILGMLAIPAFLIGSVLSARRRFRRSQGDERTQMLWFATAALAIPGGLASCLLSDLVGGEVLLFLGVTVLGTVVPAAIGAAILRDQLFDIELVLSRALTYGTLTAAVIAVYAGVLFGLGAVVDRSIAGLIAVGVVAVAIQPVHARLRRRVERWVYGDRSDPYAAIRRLSQRVEGLADPADVMAAVTRSVAEALRVSEVAIDLDVTGAAVDRNGSDRAAVPAQVHDRRQRRVSLIHQGSRLGDLVVDIPNGRQFSLADDAVLDDLARHAAAVVNAVHMTIELQHSRARLVTAREEERRRLRRDLHDGVGPSLAAMVLKLNAVSRNVDDPVADELLTQVRNETKAAIGEIRRLVDNLRPPALDEVGLVAALSQRASALSEAPLLIGVESPQPLPAMPAAVEVAAYRIATEAMTNASRHSGATRCAVCLSVGVGLEVTITDNGRGVVPRAADGVGLSSMLERAAELGGTCDIARRAEGGTIVRACIPLPADVAVVDSQPAGPDAERIDLRVAVAEQVGT